MSLLLVFTTAMMAAACLAQLHQAQHGHACCQAQQHHPIGNAQSQLATPAVVAIGQPMPHSFFGFLNLFSVHATVTRTNPHKLKNFYSCILRRI